MKKVKFGAELSATIICLYMIYSLAVKPVPSANGQSLATVTLKKMATETVTKEMQEINIHAAIAGTQDVKSLEIAAKTKAQHMIATGDISAFEAELKKNGRLLNMGR